MFLFLLILIGRLLRIQLLTLLQNGRSFSLGQRRIWQGLVLVVVLLVIELLSLLLC